MSTRKKFFASYFSTPQSSRSVARSVLPDKFKLAAQEVTFRTDNQIGKGGSATVYAGSFGLVSVAVKVYNFDKPSLPVNQFLLQKETAELVALHYANIVTCFGLCIEKNCLVFALARKQVTVDGICHTIHSLRQLVDTLPTHLFQLELQ
jgi:hypothetical protein